MLRNSHFLLHRKQLEGEKENHHSLHKQKTNNRIDDFSFFAFHRQFHIYIIMQLDFYERIHPQYTLPFL